MRTYRLLALILFACGSVFPAAPLRLGIVGLADGHANGVLGGGGDPSAGRLPSRLLVPAGALLQRSDVQIVGVAEPSRPIFDQFSQRLHVDPKLYYASLDELISRAHPEAVMIFTATLDHTKLVEECARRGVHVMMEKPLAVSYKDALAMADAAEKGHIHVLVDYETSWYAANRAAYDLLQQGALGDVWKIVTHHGNSGPFSGRQNQSASANFHMDEELSGAGVLFNFGCYGADLITWLMKGQAPLTVTAVAKQVNPGNHTKVDDEADIVLTYPSAVAIIQASWNFPFSRKDMEIYGRTGTAKTFITTNFETDALEVRRAGEKEAQVIRGQQLRPPYDDPLHYFAAVIRGEIRDEGSLSSLKTNITVSEILDAARRSVQSGQTVTLPLKQ